MDGSIEFEIHWTEINYREVAVANEPSMDNCIVSHPASEQDIIVKFQLGAHPIQHELNHK